jgi:ubiquinone/menaquinone biosynthesis C-methylase UbiE
VVTANEGGPTETEPMAGGAADAYAMGRSEAETERLIRQSGLYAPFTRRLLEQAGLGRGVRVLDVGTGAGDVALMVAEMVGPSGSVVGVDHNPEVLQTARARAVRAGFTNATFVQGDAGEMESDGGFDAAVGRLVLMHQSDPAKTLRSVAAMVRGGGTVAFQEYNVTSRSMVAFPPTRLWEDALGWIAAALERAGVETEMGFKLRRTFLEAGLPEPRMELHAPVGGGPRWGGYEFAAGTLRTLLPLVERFGIATAEDVGVDTLADRLREEMVASDGVGKPPEMVSAWAQKP